MSSQQNGSTPKPSGWVGEDSSKLGQQQQQQPQAESSSMIQVVCNQRDRFRARKMELEGEVSKLQAELVSAKTHVAATTADNVALIERLR